MNKTVNLYASEGCSLCFAANEPADNFKKSITVQESIVPLVLECTDDQRDLWLAAYTLQEGMQYFVFGADADAVYLTSDELWPYVLEHSLNYPSDPSLLPTQVADKPEPTTEESSVTEEGEEAESGPAEAEPAN